MKSISDSRLIVYLGLWGVVTLCGCATSSPTNLSLQQRHRSASTDEFPKLSIHRSEPNTLVRKLSEMADRPTRIVPFGRKAMLHGISPATEDRLADFINKNHLNDLYICVNEYDPKGEWQRLKENQQISPGWKYSLGVLSWIGYTVLPEPILCANSYNPFTNRLSLNRDDSLEILYQAARAKAVRSNPYPGPYIAMSFLPGISLIPGIKAVNDVVADAKEARDWELERDAYRRLYPQIGMETGMLAIVIVPIWWEGPLLGLAGSFAGRVAGSVQESRRSREIESIAQQDAIDRVLVEQANFSQDEVAPANVEINAHIEGAENLTRE